MIEAPLQKRLKVIKEEVKELPKECGAWIEAKIETIKSADITPMASFVRRMSEIANSEIRATKAGAKEADRAFNDAYEQAKYNEQMKGPRTK